MSTDDRTTTGPDDNTPDGRLPTPDGTTEPVPDDPILLLCGAAYSCPVEVLNYYVDGLIKAVAALPPGAIWPATRTAFPEMIADRLVGMGVSHERTIMVTCAATIAMDMAAAAREAYPPARDDSPIHVKD